MPEANEQPHRRESRPEIEATQQFPAASSANQVVSLLDAFMADLQAGKQPDREKLLADHPEIASQLRECLAGIEFVHKASHSLNDAPSQLSDFRIIREVGRGGMGVVYEAEQISLKRRVALKVLRLGGVADSEAIARFQREAETVAGLDHAHIVPVYAVGACEGVHYFAMQFIEGCSLADVATRRDRRPSDEPQGASGERGALADMQPAPRQIAEWGLQASRALSYAHRHGVIHRDVKPSNLILADDGELWLTDFGLARRDIDATLSIAGALLGTPRYMSPEQASATQRPIDHRTDIYSLGATLYELSTGKPVFEAETPIEVISQILNVQPAAPRHLAPKLPRDLETIILKSLAKAPADRYATAADLAEDLQAFLDDRPIRARRPSMLERGGQLLRRHRRIVSVAGLSAAISVLLLVGALFATRYYRESALGSVTFTTSGPHMIGEILDEHDQTIVSGFPIPTSEPLKLPSGAYRVRLAADGMLSETWPLEVERGEQRALEVHLRSRWLWPPKELDPSAFNQIDAVKLRGAGPADDGSIAAADLLIVSFESPKSAGQYQTRIRCLDGRTGESNWPNDLILNKQTAPLSKHAHEWLTLLSNPGIRSDDLRRLVGPLEDLNGDGTRDLVFLSRCATSMLAVSGADGSVLWWFRAHPPLPGGKPAVSGTWSRRVNGAVLGWPAVADADGDGTADIIACYLSGGETFAPQTGSSIASGRKCWIEATSGKSGLSLWQAPMQAKLEMALNSSNEADQAQAGCRLQLASVGDRRIVVAVIEQRLVGIGLASGEPAWKPHELGFSLQEGLLCRDLDGDGRDDLLLVRELRQDEESEFVALRLESQGPAQTSWRAAIERLNDRGSGASHEGKSRYVVEDLNSDGVEEIVVCTGKFRDATSGGLSSYDRWSGVEMLNGANGKPRWRRRLNETGFYRPEEIDRLTSGPDLNGDGFREIFAAWIAPPGQSEGTAIQVVALSGHDGKTLWRWHDPVGQTRSSNDPSGRLMWWQPGSDGWPLLVVPVANARGGQHMTYFLGASTGNLEHTLSEVFDPRIADFNGDGVADLFYRVSPQGAPRMLVVERAPAESWRRLGAWRAIEDINGDGVEDFLKRDGLIAASGSENRILWNRHGADRMFRNTKLELAPTAPWGDVNQDGAPDLIGFESRRGQRSGAPSYHALAAYSGKNGQPLWQSEDFGLGSGSSTGGGMSGYYNYPAVDWTDLDRDRRAEIIVAHMPRGQNQRNTLMFSVLDTQNGALRWQSPMIRGGYLSWPDPYGRAFDDLNGDGVGDPVLWTPLASEEGPHVLRAINGRNGSSVWIGFDAKVERRELVLWARPAVGDLDGDKRSEVIATRHKPYVKGKGYENELLVLDGNTGKKKWSHSWLGNADILPPLLVELDGAGRRCVCLGVNEGGKDAILILTPEGEVRQRIAMATQGGFHNHLALWNKADVDGDGREELLFKQDGALVVSRGGAGDALWSWKLPDTNAMLLDNGLAARSHELAVWSGTTVFGLDRKSGGVVWKCEGPLAPQFGASHPPSVRLLNGGQPEAPPRVVFAGPSYSQPWATVAYQASAVAADGRLLATAPEPRRFEPLGEPSLPGRALPWMNPREPSLRQHVECFAIQSGLAALVILALPIWMIRRTARRRSWLLALVLAAYCAFFTLGPLAQAASNIIALALPVWLLTRAARRRSRADALLGLVSLLLLIAPLACLHLLWASERWTALSQVHAWGSWWWLDELAGERALLGLVSFPGLIFWWLLARAVRASQWKRVRRMAGLSAALAGLLAAAWLYWDMQPGSLADYSRNGWYIIWFWSTFLIGVVYLLYRLVLLCRWCVLRLVSQPAKLST